MNKKAFTLIELLVVIAIVSVMMGLVIPSLARAKEQGREVYCQSNLRQLHIAAMVYAQCQRGFFPIAYYSTSSMTEKVSYCWDFTVRRYSDGSRIVEAGILWQGDTIEKIQQCPSFRGSSNMAADPFTGYNYNTSYIGHGQSERIPLPAKTGDIRKPGSCALFGDGQTTTGANKFMRSPFGSESDEAFSGRWGGVQGFRHSMSSNIVWCDGSAASMDQVFTGNNADQTQQNLETYNQENPRSPIGFLSADNSSYRP